MDSSHGGYAQLESNNATVSRLALQDKIPWYKKPNLRLLYLLMLPTCFAAEFVSGFDSAMTNALQAVPTWIEYYHDPRSALLGLVASVFAVGAFVSAPFVPLVADRYGRRYSMLLGSIVSIVGGILQGTAMNLTMFIIARFISGLGVVFGIVAALTFAGELSHPKERAILNSIMNTFNYTGAAAAAAVTLGTFAIPNNWAWRIPSFLQIVPSLLQITFIWFFPESPRWLISKGRQDEAYAILVKYHAEGDSDSELVKAEYTQIENTLALETRNAQMNSKDVLATPGMRKRVIIATFLALFAQWSGTGLISHFLTLILDSIGVHDHRTKNIVNLAKFSWGLVNGLVLAMIVPRYPRRRMFLLSTSLIFVFFLAWTAASAVYSNTHSEAATKVVMVLIFLHSPAFNMGINPLTNTYLVEVFPFHVRAQGLSIFQQWCRGAAFFGQFMNPIGLDALGWRWYIVYCVWAAFEVVFIYLMFPETSGRTLEELAFLYEDDGPSRTRIGVPREPVGAETCDAHETTPLLFGGDDRVDNVEAHNTM